MGKNKPEKISSGPVIAKYQLEDRLGDFVKDVMQAGFTVKAGKGRENVFLIHNTTGKGTYLCGNIRMYGRETNNKGEEIPSFTLEINYTPFEEELHRLAKDYTLVRIE